VNKKTVIVIPKVLAVTWLKSCT